nr:transposase [Pseudarcicella sp.]
YSGEPCLKIVQNKELESQIHAKGSKRKPLTKLEFEQNRQKSTIRARIEYVFGFMEISMNTMKLKQIGKARIEASIGMMNLVYNMFRKIQILAV